MDWYRRAQAEDKRGTIDFVVSYPQFTAFRKENFGKDIVPFAANRAIKNLDGKTYTISYYINSGIGSEDVILKCPQGMLPMAFDFLEPMIKLKVHYEALKGEGKTEPGGDNKFEKRTFFKFPYTFKFNTFLGLDNESDWKNDPAISTLKALDGKVFEINTSADFMQHGVYNIKPYRPEDMDDWIWSHMLWDIKNEAREKAFEELNQIRDEMDPTTMIANKMMEE